MGHRCQEPLFVGM